jgi:hypothetical protein
MKKEDAAWLAAAIDGEGSIICSTNSRGIIIANTNKAFLERVVHICRGGSIVEGKPQKAHYKVPYKFVIYSKRLQKKVLESILPYLIIKQELGMKLLLKIFEDGLEVRNDKKGWRGDSEAHKLAANSAKNHMGKGWRGDSEGHKKAALGETVTTKK